MSKLRIWRWRDYLELFGWVGYHHKGPFKETRKFKVKKEEKWKSERDPKMPRLPVLGRWRKGAVSKGEQAASRRREGKDRFSPLRASRRGSSSASALVLAQ